MSVLQVPAVHAPLPTSHGISIALHRGLRKTQGIVPHLEGECLLDTNLTYSSVHHKILAPLVEIVSAGGDGPLSILCLTKEES